jgi:glutaredoxin
MGADLVEYNIEKDKSKRDEMRQKVGGGSGVPVIDIEGTIIRGYNQGAIKAALDRNAR